MKFLKKVILICFLLMFSCAKERKENDTIIGNWQLNSVDDKKSDDYFEMYIDTKYMYVYNEIGLIYVHSYKLEKDSLLHIDGISTSKKFIKTHIKNGLLTVSFLDSIKIKFNKIKNGILPQDFVENNNLEENYYQSFIERQSFYLDTVD